MKKRIIGFSLLACTFALACFNYYGPGIASILVLAAFSSTFLLAGIFPSGLLLGAFLAWLILPISL